MTTSLRPASTILMNAENLQTDITGLLLQDSDAKSARWQSLFPILTSKLEKEAKRTDFTLDPIKEKLWKLDLQSFADLQTPTLERQSRGPGTRRRHRARVVTWMSRWGGIGAFAHPEFHRNSMTYTPKTPHPPMQERSRQ